ncbi:DNA polymerase subunit delta-2 [Hypsizygus marmoreus]|uniref:DNA-directed DNA polymerase n=1 Tax=Hypsizygus marmoreus TaxID=39966 RepID=A0A369JUT1_HYPMA|nr:DNA polymerase subunit delta-2 [Hypsizygus marmoreus]
MPSIDALPTASTHTRAVTAVLPSADDACSFLINRANKSYKHQYANIYFVRLRLLRQFVEARAHQRWKNVDGEPILVPRVLEVVKSQLCYIVGTVYMDMPLKPNVMEDIARDHSIPPPPPPLKFYSPDDNVMLEDESGRIRLVGERVGAARLVTGVIIGALGAETANGDFEVIDICYPGMAPQAAQETGEPPDEEKMDVDGQSTTPDEWIGIISGLDIGSPSPSDAQIQMLVEYLTGEEGGVAEQVSAAQISRLIIAGNSLATIAPTGRGESIDIEQQRKPRRYGYDAANFSPHPVLSLSDHLLDIGSAMPIHILPGDTDPSGTIMPQQPFPRAMLGAVSKLPSFSCETNPTYLRLSCDAECKAEASSRPTITRTLLVNSGQPVNDMFKYLPSPPNTRLSILESTLRWRHMAPTAPDTLWCHPYFGRDPFIITETPDLYIVGNQKRFSTKIVVDEEAEADGARARCRIIMVPEFARTGVLVLVNLRSLDVKTVTFAVEGMTGGGEEVLQPEAEASKAPSPPPALPESSAPHLQSSPEFM